LTDLIVVSHACFTAINRNVYHLFAKDGWNPEIVLPKTLQFSSGKKIAEPPQPGDPPLHYLDLIGTNPRTYYFGGLINLLNQKLPRIILLDNDPVSRMTILLGKWAKKNKAWLFCISNDNLPLDIRSALRRRGWKGLAAAIVKRWMLHESKKLVDGIFTINRDGENIFRQEGYINVRQMPLGFDPEYFHPDANARLRIREKLNLQHKVVSYFGRLTPEKGAHILIQALEQLKQYPWQLMMDSFDPYASEYNERVHKMLEQAGIADRVVFIHPSHTEIPGFMNAADLVVVPSVSTPFWKEQYGRVAAEAMACGKTVIASDSGALPDLLNGHGYLFKEANMDSLRNILEKLITGSINGAAGESEISAYALQFLSIQKQKAVMEEAFQ
jgi:glycosyltransferase involved in cell wall biosynthesis